MVLSFSLIDSRKCFEFLCYQNDATDSLLSKKITQNNGATDKSQVSLI